MILALAAQQKLELQQFDVKTAFLYGEISEEIYMEPPPGVSVKAGTVCKLTKSLCRLKQSPRC